jgi:PAS domain S-box-containing protein
VFSAVKDAETSQRGYVLTGDETYLEPYSVSRRRLDSLLIVSSERLREQKVLSNSLQALISQKMTLLDSIIGLRRTRGFIPAQALVAGKQGKFLMDSIRAVCEEIHRIKHQKVTIAIAESQAYLYNTKLTIAISASIVIALFLGAAVVMSRVLRAGAASNQALLEQKRLTDAILDTVPSFVYVFDVQRGKFDYVNDFFETLTGYPSQELRAHGVELLWSRIHPNDVEVLRNRFEEITREGLDNTVYESDYRMQHRDGSWRYFTDRALVFRRDETGKIRQMISFLYDITNRVRAEQERVQSETLLKGVLNTSLYGIVVVEAVRNDKQEIADFRYTLLNEAARKGFGRPLEEVQVSTMSQIFPAVLQTGQFSRYCEVVETGKSAIFDVQYVGDGYYNWFTNVCSKLNDGLVILYYDISDRKVAEMKISELNTALANSNTDLERLVEERTAQLHRVNQELVFTNQQFQETNKELEAFSYSVSHDLRAPLRSVNGFAEMLRERYKDQFDEEGLRLLGRITNGAQKMGILIDELLALSRLGRKALQISDVNMTEIVHSVLEELNTHNELADYSIEISALPNAACDTALLRQVWVNLLSNAVKYSRHSASKSISITFFMQNGTPVYAVRDQGVGFDMRYADKLFNVFQRLHKERDFEGTGIGLAIVKRIITKHGGQVWAEAEINNGATFFFSLLNLSSRNIP